MQLDPFEGLGQIHTAPFQLAQEALGGSRVPMPLHRDVENVAILGQNSAIAVFSVSDNGVLVFQTGSPATDRVLTRKNLETNETTEIGRLGVWTWLDAFKAPEAAEFATGLPVPSARFTTTTFPWFPERKSLSSRVQA